MTIHKFNTDSLALCGATHHNQYAIFNWNDVNCPDCLSIKEIVDSLNF